MPLDFDDHPFWDYSLRVYGSEGVPAACLILQDRLEIDVNVMLFCSWIGHSGRGVMTAAELDAALGAVSEWNESIVRGLRAVRQALKGGLPPAPDAQSAALRRRILKLEVDSEHAEQLILARAVDRPGADGLPASRRAADAVANIGAYFARHGAALVETDAECLAAVLGAAFTELDTDTVVSLCRELVDGHAGAAAQ